MQTVADKIKAAITLRGFSTVKECAQSLGLPYELFRKVVGENHIPKDEQLLIYATKLGINPKDLLFTAYHQKAPNEFKEYFKKKIINISPIQRNKIPLLSWEDIDGIVSRGGRIENLPAVNYIYTNIQSPGLFAVEVKGNTMNPLFIEGDTLVVDTAVLPQSDDYVIATNMKDNISYFNQLKKYKNVKILHNLNPRYEDYEVTKDIHIIGKVIRHQKDF